MKLLRVISRFFKNESGEMDDSAKTLITALIIISILLAYLPAINTAARGGRTWTISGALSFLSENGYKAYADPAGIFYTNDIVPNANNTYDLGSTGSRWRNLWIAGNVNGNPMPTGGLVGTTDTQILSNKTFIGTTVLTTANITTVNAPTGRGVFSVAASNAPAAIRSQADYVADGTSDQDTIALADTAAAAVGGIVQLSEGTFNIDNTAIPSSNVIWQGKGNSTVLNISGQKTVYMSNDNVTIRDFKVIGSGYVFFYANNLVADGILVTTDNTVNGAFIIQTDVGVTLDNIQIRNCASVNSGTYGFIKTSDGTLTNLVLDNDAAINSGKDSRVNDYVVGFDLAEAGIVRGLRANNLYASGSWRSGIFWNVPLDHAVISNSIAVNNSQSGALSANFLSSGGQVNMSNLYSENGFYGFQFSGLSNINAVGLTDNGSGYGFYLESLTGRTFIGDSQSINADDKAIYTGTATGIVTRNLQLISSGDGGLASAGAIISWVGAQTTNSDFNIYASNLGGSTGIYSYAPSNVKFSGYLYGTNVYPIQIDTAGALTEIKDMIIETGNGATAAIYANGGTTSLIKIKDTVIRDIQAVPNLAYGVQSNVAGGPIVDDVKVTGATTSFSNCDIPYNQGIATILNGNAAVIIAHGLAATPTNIKLTGKNAEVSALWITGDNTTSFTINVSTNVTGNREIYWWATTRN